MFKIVVSGVNLTDSGKLTVLYDCLASLKKVQHQKYINVTVLVHKKNLVHEYENIFTILEYPEVKKSWINRINFEYKFSKELSRELKPDLWLGLHDITANVESRYKVVYCHNPTPFYKLELKDAFSDLKFTAFCIFYKYLYGINIKKNNFAIVQQNWLRKNFEKLYKVKTVVAHPVQDTTIYESSANVDNLGIDFSKHIFFFPSYPRVYKNYDVIAEAAKIVAETNPDFQVILTSDGTETTYVKNIYKNCKDLPYLKFIGLQSRFVIEALYGKTDCLIFPSKLETWGLPISEFKSYNKPMLLADLPYAYETIGAYDKVCFFEVNDHKTLSQLMLNAINNKLNFVTTEAPVYQNPVFYNWDDLTDFLTNSESYTQY